MKVVIFAGGRGSRLSEETSDIPKPMIEIGGKPILWHIMKIYSHYGYNDFIICLGYKGNIIKEWFANYFLYNSDITINLSNNEMQIHKKRTENWKVTLVDTGLDANTATRLKKVQEYIGDEDFMLTYGDGVGDVNIGELVNFHKNHNKIATVTATQPEHKFGIMRLGDSGRVISFHEKTGDEATWINGGFFILRPGVFNYLPDKDVMWEREPLERLSIDGQLMSFRHKGFWKPMDTLRDKIQLEEFWESGNPPWKIWKD